MGLIKQMPAALANQIAAGEVVERPASVVKELVENAIDARSQSIRVELEEAGVSRITVIDDGEGMAADDLEMAFLPHATSKIFDLDDLFHIHSLGFRGEALASIGSVAHVRVESLRQGGLTGNYIEIQGSYLLDQGECAGKQGTRVEVSNLFYNTPARLKHLKTLQTELKHSIKFVQNMALAYPHIQFSLMNNSQEIFKTHGRGQVQQAIANIYQPSLARQLLEIKAEDPDFSIYGYVSPPTLTRTSRDYLHWFINGRHVYSSFLNQVVLQAYGRQLMIGRYPICVIYINLDPRLVDVNVHPTKQTVRLSKEKELSNLLNECLVSKLKSINPVPSLSQSLENKEDKESQQLDYIEEVPLNFSSNSSRNSKSHLGKQESWSSSQRHQALKDALTSSLNLNRETNVDERIYESDGGQACEGRWLDSKTNPSKDSSESFDTGHASFSEDSIKAYENAKQNQAEEVPAIDFQNLRYVGQIHGTYLIAESSQAFYLIDQHAAQERLRYEAFLKYDPDLSQQQVLLLPYVYEFTPEEQASLLEVMPVMEALGIYLQALGPRSYQLESYPNWIQEEDLKDLIYKLLHLLQEQPDISIPKLKEASIIMQSCRGAIKANHHLDDRQASALIRDMADLEDPYHCPHGRPVFVEFDQKALEKLFKRIQDPHERGQNR